MTLPACAHENRAGAKFCDECGNALGSPARRGAVDSHGGKVTQLLGDGVKAVFGIPRVAEDDAIRAALLRLSHAA